jgi:hypothetical protein
MIRAADGREELDDGHDTFERDEDGERDENRDNEWRKQHLRQHFDRRKQRQRHQHQHSQSDASSDRFASMAAPPRAHPSQQHTQEDVHGAEGDGKAEKGNRGLLAIEDRAQPNRVAERTEEFAEKHTEGDCARRARERHRRHRPQCRAGRRLQVHEPSEGGEHQSVADVAKNQPEKSGKEDRDEGRRVDRAVLGQRQHARQNLERAEQRWIVQRHGCRLGGPVFDPDSRHDDLGTEGAPHALLQVGDAGGRQPALDDEQVVSGEDTGSCVQLQKPIAQEHAQARQPHAFCLRDRSTVRINCAQSLRNLCESCLDRRQRVEQILLPDSRRRWQFLDSRC